MSLVEDQDNEMESVMMELIENERLLLTQMKMLQTSDVEQRRMSAEDVDV